MLVSKSDRGSYFQAPETSATEFRAELSAVPCPVRASPDVGTESSRVEGAGGGGLGWFSWARNQVLSGDLGWTV